MQAVSAVNTFNGTDLAGRKIMVREDREDRDVKQYNRENGIETPPVPRCVGHLLEALLLVIGGRCARHAAAGSGGACSAVRVTAAELGSASMLNIEQQNETPGCF